ncbi:MAG TPA: hypothetical protein VGP55_16165 [Chitinophagaceae bacterium]|nr:hypothetical protein [Chitinophagaceae bacterium]
MKPLKKINNDEIIFTTLSSNINFNKEVSELNNDVYLNSNY